MAELGFDLDTLDSDLALSYCTHSQPRVETSMKGFVDLISTLFPSASFLKARRRAPTNCDKIVNETGGFGVHIFQGLTSKAIGSEIFGKIMDPRIIQDLGIQPFGGFFILRRSFNRAMSAAHVR